MLYHEISGNGKKPLVLLHGFMENTTIWEEMGAHLSKDFTLIKIDYPDMENLKFIKKYTP